MKQATDEKKFLVVVLPVVFILLVVLGSKFFATRNSKKTQERLDTGSQAGESQTVSDNNLNGELPGHFPKQFPIYEHAVIDESWEKESGSGYAASVVWKVDAPTAVVFNFYEEKLVLANYEISVLSGDSNSYTISFSKEGESGFVGITVDDSKETIISVTIGSDSGLTK